MTIRRSTSTTRAWKRAELMSELRREWHKEYDVYIGDGEREVAEMLRRGPTVDGLATARELGILPAGPMGEFFAARWEVAAAAGEAQRITEIIRDPDKYPTDEELERLADILEEYAEHEEFAYLLGLELGPEGVIETSVGVAALADQGEHEALARIQQGLGVALATATTQRGEYESDPYQGGRIYRPGEYELPPDWVARLAIAGRELYPVPVHGEPEVYGYQALGPLLSHGVYDEHFLGLIGGDMIDLEMELGGSAHWPPLHVGNPPEWIPLDLSLSGEQAMMDRSYGHDPIVNLMEAFEANPYGARAALAGRTETSEEGVEYLPRVDYLVTDREWGPAEAGLPQFGRALEHAAGVSVEQLPTGEFRQLYPPDDRSYQIVESIVYAVANDEEVKGYPNDPSGGGEQLGDQALGFAQAEIVPDALRPYVGRVVAGYIDDVHWAINDHQIWHEDLPGEPHLRLPAGDLMILLAEMGKNAEARDTIMLAEEIYAAALYDHFLSGSAGHEGDSARIAAETNATFPAAKVYGALDYGAATEIDDQWNEQADEFNQALRNQYALSGAGIALAEDLGMPGTAGYMAQEMLDQSEESREADYSGEAQRDKWTLRDLSRERLQDQAEVAAYYHLDPDDLPGYARERLVDENGELKPFEEWAGDPNSPEREAWEIYRSNEGADYVNRMRQAAETDYEIAFNQAQKDLGVHISTK